MSAAAPFELYVNKNGTATLMAYVEGNAGTPITQASLSAIVYTISIVDENDADSDSTITGHAAASLTVASVVFDTEQKDDVRWIPANHGGKGYNFLFTPVISTNPAFSTRGRRYRVRVKFTPATGQAFWAEWIASPR